MGQVIVFPRHEIEKKIMADRIRGAASTSDRQSAKVLFFTGVRYERVPTPTRMVLPSQRILPPFPR